MRTIRSNRLQAKDLKQVHWVFVHGNDEVAVESAIKLVLSLIDDKAKLQRYSADGLSKTPSTDITPPASIGLFAEPERTFIDKVTAIHAGKLSLWLDIFLCSDIEPGLILSSSVKRLEGKLLAAFSGYASGLVVTAESEGMSNDVLLRLLQKYNLPQEQTPILRQFAQTSLYSFMDAALRLFSLYNSEDNSEYLERFLEHYLYGEHSTAAEAIAKGNYTDILTVLQCETASVSDRSSLAARLPWALQYSKPKADIALLHKERLDIHDYEQNARQQHPLEAILLERLLLRLTTRRRQQR